VTSATIARPHGTLQRQSRWRWAEIAFWLATFPPFVLAPDYLLLASQVAVAALFVLSLDLILGFAGIVSLGQTPLISASASTLPASFPNGAGANPSPDCVAALVAGAFGYLTSFVIARFRHLPLIMITLGIGLLLQEAANSASWLTGGFDGLQGIHTWTIAEKSISICTAIPHTATRSRCCF